MSKKKKATTEQVVAWVEDANQFQRRWIVTLAQALGDVDTATYNLLDHEDEPF